MKIAYGLRIGASNYLAIQDSVQLHHIIIRGGWSMEDVCKVFEYLLQLSSTVAIGGRALAHAPDIYKGAFPPKMIADADPETKEFFSRFVNILLLPKVPERFATSSLRTLLDIVAAELIMRHDKMLVDLGGHDPVVKLITATVKQLNMTPTQFRNLGAAIESDWLKRNGISANRRREASHSNDATGPVDIQLEAILAELDAKFDSKIDTAIDLIVDKIVEKLRTVLPIRFEQVLPGTNNSETESRVQDPQGLSTGTSSLPTIGDRGSAIPQILTLRKLSLASLIEQYYSNYMDKYSDATWKIAIPSRIHRSKISTVIRYALNNILVNHLECINSRPHVNLPAFDQQVRK